MSKKQIAVVLSIAMLCAIGTNAAKPGKQKLKIFILSGQSNMVGHAHYITVPALLDAKEPEVRQLAKMIFKEGGILPGDMTSYFQVLEKLDSLDKDLSTRKIEGKDRIAALAERRALQAELDARADRVRDAFNISERVYITSTADHFHRSGPLTYGYGARENIGPELGFGMSIEQKLDGPILLIKTSWGGKSLYYDFLPPSAGPYELTGSQANDPKAQQIKDNAGWYYRMMNETVREVLKGPGKYHPDYDPEAGYEIAGFVWFQGHMDMIRKKGDTYKDNMIAFINDVRKEYQLPNMPFVIGPGAGQDYIYQAQRQAAEAPQFKGTVVSIDTAPLYPYDAEEAHTRVKQNPYEFLALGSDAGYHFMGSGTFFVRLGDVMATAMSAMIKGKDGDSSAKTRGADRLSKGLIGYWRFDEGQGTTSADSSDLNNKAILKGGAGWTDGLIGKALQAGKGQYAEVPGYKDPITKGRIENLSVSYWIQAAEVGSARVGKGKETSFPKDFLNWFISYWASGGGWDVACWDSYSVPFFTATFDSKPYGMGAGGDKTVRLPPYMFKIVYDGKEWHHVVAVYNGSQKTMSLYVDGNKAGVGWTFNPRGLKGLENENHIVPALDDILTFGGKFKEDGKVEAFDEIAIWDRPLTDEEVKSLFNEGLGAEIL